MRRPHTAEVRGGRITEGALIHRWILIVACAVFALAFWKRNDVPAGLAVDAALAADPAQTPTWRPPFTTRWDGIEYTVEPQFEYDLYGVIVSYRQHGEASRMHRLAKDHLNMADVCVVWGGDATSEYLAELDFWNGVFTCNVHTSSREAWESFDMTEMSNNHLISDDPAIRERVADVAIGDQVHIKGVLASYGAHEGGRRGTSTTREDTGDGACEVIFVDTFEVIRPSPSSWRLTMYLSLAVIAAALLWYFRQPYRPYTPGIERS